MNVRTRGVPAKVTFVSTEFDADSQMPMTWGTGSREAARVGKTQVKTGAQMRSRSEPAREGVPSYQYAEPLGIYKVGVGFHCVVVTWIGGVRFRITLDTGCARDFVRTAFREQLQKSGKTANSLLKRQEGDRMINCTGIVKDMETDPIAYHSTVKLLFKDVPDDGSKGEE